MKALIAFATGLLAAAPAFGVTIVYTTSLSGPNENPPIASPGVGVGTVTVDTTAHTLRVQEKFSGLTTGRRLRTSTAASRRRPAPPALRR